jgi:hypothetical protein
MAPDEDGYVVLKRLTAWALGEALATQTPMPTAASNSTSLSLSPIAITCEGSIFMFCRSAASPIALVDPAGRTSMNLELLTVTDNPSIRRTASSSWARTPPSSAQSNAATQQAPDGIRSAVS